MKRHLTSQLTLALVSTTILYTSTSFASDPAALWQEPNKILSDGFIIKYKENSSHLRFQTQADDVSISAINAQQASTAAGYSMRHVRRLATGFALLKHDQELSDEEKFTILERLKADPNVESVELNLLLQPAFTPNDPDFSRQWHYTSSSGGINLERAWDTSTGEGAVVAVLDTGYVPHPDLDGNLLPGYDFISSTRVSRDGNGRDNNPIDEGDWYLAGECGQTQGRDSSWHGTHVSGTVAAVTNNGTGVAGVAFGARILPVRVLGYCGGALNDIAEAIIWASGGSVTGVPTNTNPADVINLSLSGERACSPNTQRAINIAVRNGSTVVVAAGNQNRNAGGTTPANCNNVITVAATTPDGGKAHYSNFGSMVDVAAPGGDRFFPNGEVLSTSNDGERDAGSPNYEAASGTSMATPHVAGVAALLYAEAPDITPSEVYDAIVDTARAFPATCNGCGSGILDARAALDVLTQPSPPAPPQPSDSPPDIPGCTTLNFANTSAYSNENSGDSEVSPNGFFITLSGNVWRITDFDYTIQPSTTLRFDLSATGTAEIMGVGFDSTNDATASPDRIFKLSGTQNWGITGYTYNGGTQSFTIPVGESYTGSNMGFVIANDNDFGTPNNTVTVSNAYICN